MKKLQLASLAAFFCLLVLAAGCGGPRKTVYIQDGRVRTEVTVPVSADVETILRAAELSVGDRDELSLPRDAVPEADAEISIERWAQVTVVTETGRKEVSLCGATVADALRESGVKLGENDVVNYDPAVFLSEVSGEITVTRMFRVTVTADGAEQELLSPKATVREILDTAGIALGELDRVSPDPGNTVTADVAITVQRVEKKTETQTVSIPYTTQKEYSSSLASGKTQVKREGVNGSKEVTYEVTYVDGEETERTAVSEKVLRQPVNAVVVYGTQQASSGKTVVSRENFPDCDGSGHGYYKITYSDGSVEYVDY